MAAKKKAKKEVEVIEAEVIEEVKTAPESIDLNNYVILRENYDVISETVNTIRGLLSDTVDNYLKIGYLLNSITDEKLKELGCDSIYEFSKANFNLGITSTKNFINVYKKFGEKTSNIDCLPSSQVHFIRLKNEFKDFSMSQLVELLPVSDENFDKFSPDMTCKDIRALKKASQLTDFESDFYEKVKKAFFEIWNKVYQSLNFETINKINDENFILDGYGSFTFNIPCLGEYIIFEINSDVKTGKFSIYIEPNNCSFSNVYKSFSFKLDEDYLARVNNIIKFINNDCYEYLEKNISSKNKVKSPDDVLSKMIEKKIDKYIGTMMRLSDFEDGDFYDFYEYAKKNSITSYIRDQDNLRKYSLIPYDIFLQEFELVRFDLYKFKLKKVLFENSPYGNNPNYSLVLVIDTYRGLYFSIYWDDLWHDDFILDSLENYLDVDTLDQNENYKFNSIFSIYYYFAKVWAEDRYNNRSNHEEFDEDDYDDEDNDVDESEDN